MCKKKLKEKLRRAKAHLHVSQMLIDSWRDLALALKAGASFEEPLRGSSEWRPISERPTETTRAIIWDKYGKDSFIDNLGMQTSLHPDYTHWMPMPEGPVLGGVIASPSGSLESEG